MSRRLGALIQLALCPFLGLCATAIPAAAQSAPAAAFDRAAVSVTTTGAVNRTLGWEFRALDSVQLTAIGVFDAETGGAPMGGLATLKTVALFDLTQNLLASASVPAGSGGVLCRDGFRYVSLPPTNLVAGQSYVVACYWQQDDGSGNFDDYPDIENSNAPVAFHSSVEFIQPRFRLGGAGLLFPTGVLPGLKSFLGALNFRIGAGGCDPSTSADLTTTFDSDNGFAGSMFDLRATHPAGLTVDAFQVNIGDVVPQSELIDIAVWWRHGSYANAVSSSAGWNLLGVVAVQSWGRNQPTPVPLGGLVLPVGETVGVYIALADYTEDPPNANVPLMHYTGIGPSPASHANSELVLEGGVGKGAPPFSGSSIPSRMWNGGVLYSVGGTPFVAFCAGDGSAANCPCANLGGAGEGCANSQGLGARIEAVGTNSVIAGGPILEARQLPPGSPLVFFEGLNATGAGQGIPFADGLRCVGGSVVRLAVRVADPGGNATTGQRIGGARRVAPGETRHYQVWYRDAAGGPCGAGSNTSGALRIDWAL